MKFKRNLFFLDRESVFGFGFENENAKPNFLGFSKLLVHIGSKGLSRQSKNMKNNSKELEFIVENLIITEKSVNDSHKKIK